VLPKHATAEEIAALRQRAEQLVADFDPETISVFSTRNQVPAAQRDVHIKVARC
jgi:hypothetical protein